MEQTISANGGSINFNYTLGCGSGSSVTGESNVEWITVDVDDSNNVITVNVAPNTSGEDRKGTVKILINGIECLSENARINFTQQKEEGGGGGGGDEDECTNPTYTLDLSENSISFNGERNTATITATGKKQCDGVEDRTFSPRYEWTGGNSWLHLSNSGSSVVTVSVDENCGDVNRNGNITCILYEGQSSKKEKTVSISQQYKDCSEPEPEEYDYSFNFNVSGISFANCDEGKSSGLTVTTTRRIDGGSSEPYTPKLKWSVSGADGNISVSGKNGSDVSVASTANASVDVCVLYKNCRTSAHTAVLTFSAYTNDNDEFIGTGQTTATQDAGPCESCAQYGFEVNFGRLCDNGFNYSNPSVTSYTVSVESWVSAYSGATKHWKEVTISLSDAYGDYDINDYLEIVPERTYGETEVTRNFFVRLKNGGFGPKTMTGNTITVSQFASVNESCTFNYTTRITAQIVPYITMEPYEQGMNSETVKFKYSFHFKSLMPYVTKDLYFMTGNDDAMFIAPTGATATCDGNIQVSCESYTQGKTMPTMTWKIESGKTSTYETSGNRVPGVNLPICCVYDYNNNSDKNVHFGITNLDDSHIGVKAEPTTSDYVVDEDADTNIQYYLDLRRRNASNENIIGIESEVMRNNPIRVKSTYQYQDLSAVDAGAHYVTEYEDGAIFTENWEKYESFSDFNSSVLQGGNFAIYEYSIENGSIGNQVTFGDSTFVPVGDPIVPNP